MLGGVPLEEHQHPGDPVAVSVLLVHTSDDPVSVRTLDTLETASRRPSSIEIVVVDVDGGGGTVPWAGREGIRVVGAAASLGYAGARNRASTVAAGEVAVFLAGDLTLSPGALDHAADVLHRDGSIAAVAMNVAGRPRPTASFRGMPGRGTAPFGAGDVLYAYAEAMAVRLEAFRRIGGFDHRFDRFGEDLDFGWRAWLMGFRVAGCPDAVATVHRPAALTGPRRAHLSTRNGLFATYKNYGSANLSRALPAALALAASPAPGVSSSEPVPARAVEEFAAAIASLDADRQEIQSNRTRTDPEVLRLFHTALDPPDEGDPGADRHSAVVGAFELAGLFGTRRRILVATPDVLTERMAGPAIRAWQIATALSAEHDVVLMTTSTVCEVSSPLFRTVAAASHEIDDLERWCEVAVVQGFVLEVAPALRHTHKTLVIDIYDPLHLEQLELERDASAERRRQTVLTATRVLNEQLVRGDFFICASPKQRDFWLGQLAGLGRVNALTYDEDETLESLLTVVPFGLPDAAPVHTRRALKGVVPGIAEDDEVILWGGGIYNWFDPVTLVRAVHRLRERRPKVRLFFMGMQHPNPGVGEMRMATETRRVARDLGLTGVHVFFNEGWVAYDDRQNYLLEADVGVSTHLDHVETAFSFRTRILDYIWAALPTVATAGDALADLIEARRLGVTVPATDVEAMEDALFRLLDDRELAAMCRKNLAAVRDEFAWSTVLSPLVEFCRSPRRAPDLANPEMAEVLGLGNLLTLPAAPRLGALHDLQVAFEHFREGGVRQVVAKSRSRLGHRLAGRR